MKIVRAAPMEELASTEAFHPYGIMTPEAFHWAGWTGWAPLRIAPTGRNTPVLILLQNLTDQVDSADEFHWV